MSDVVGAEEKESSFARRDRYWSRNWARYENLPEHERFVNREFNANGTLIYESYLGMRKEEDGGLPQEIFDAVVADVQALTDKSDFSLAALVRAYMLCERGGARTSIMNEKQRITTIAALMNFPYWLSDNEASSSSASSASVQPQPQLQSRGNVCYWTENHQALLLSSYYIVTHTIPSLSGWANEHRRAESSRLLSHFLALKQRWGFAELNSPVYSTITLAGLLNVVDFCEDATMRDAADAVLRILLDGMSAIPTSSGSFVCATTRFFDRDIVQKELRSIQSIVDIVFGIECVSRPNNSRAFQTAVIASSDWLCDAASSFSWQSDVNVTLPLTTQPSASVKSSNMCGVLTDIDRTLFNFASGRFFPPSDIKDHIAQMKQWHLFKHPHFQDLKFLKSLPTFSLTTVSSFLSPITLGHAHGGGSQRIFRRGPVSMSSLEGHEQMFGFQKLSFVVCIDADTIMWLECGCRRKVQDNLRDAITPKVSQSEDGRSATIQYTQQSHVLRFLHSKIAGSKGSGVELLSSSARTIFRPDDDLSGGYCADGIVHVRPPSHSVFVEQPEEVRENVFRHAHCSQTNQTWKFDLVGL